MIDVSIIQIIYSNNNNNNNNKFFKKLPKYNKRFYTNAQLASKCQNKDVKMYFGSASAFIWLFLK